MPSFCFENSSNPSWHAFYELLTSFWGYIYPQMFNGVNVRGLGRPAENFNFIILKPLISSFGCMFGVIVLLKDPFTLWHVQVFKAFLQYILQNLTVLLCIHFSLKLHKCLNSILAHASPYHEIVSSSMLDCWYGGPIRNAFTSWFPHIHLPI